MHSLYVYASLPTLRHSLLILAPSVILFLVFQKQFVAALLQGAVKG